jgi:hypothetical protein
MLQTSNRCPVFRFYFAAEPKRCRSQNQNQSSVFVNFHIFLHALSSDKTIQTTWPSGQVSNGLSQSFFEQNHNDLQGQRTESTRCSRLGLLCSFWPHRFPLLSKNAIPKYALSLVQKNFRQDIKSSKVRLYTSVQTVPRHATLENLTHNSPKCNGDSAHMYRRLGVIRNRTAAQLTMNTRWSLLHGRTKQWLGGGKLYGGRATVLRLLQLPFGNGMTSPASDLTLQPNPTVAESRISVKVKAAAGNEDRQ